MTLLPSFRARGVHLSCSSCCFSKAGMHTRLGADFGRASNIALHAIAVATGSSSVDGGAMRVDQTVSIPAGYAGCR